MTFCEKLIRLRKIKGLTQDEFAAVVGVSRQAVYKWESGKSYPEVQKLLEIKKLFNISIDDLLDESFEIELPKKKRRKRLSEQTKREIEERIEKEFLISKNSYATVTEELERDIEEAESITAKVKVLPSQKENENGQAQTDSIPPLAPTEEKNDIKEKENTPLEAFGENADKKEKRFGLFGRIFGRK